MDEATIQEIAAEVVARLQTLEENMSKVTNYCSDEKN